MSLISTAIRTELEKEISESHACYEDLHTHAGQKKPNIIPKEQIHRNMVNQTRTIKPHQRYLCYGGVDGRAVGTYLYAIRVGLSSP